MRRYLLPFVLTAAIGCGEQQPDPSEDTPPAAVEFVAPTETPAPKSGVESILPENQIAYLEVEGLAPEVNAHVDVIGLFEVGATYILGDTERPNRVSMMLLQNVRVADVKPTATGTAVGLEVTLDEAEVLVVADAKGALSLLERTPNDTRINALSKMTLREVLEDLEILYAKRRNRQSHATLIDEKSSGERGLVLTNTTLPEGAASKGNWVNIFGTFELPQPLVGGESNLVTVTLLQNVLVLRAEGNSVELAVTPDEAHMLTLASAAGTVSYSLRGASHEVQSISRRTFREVIEDLEVIQEKRQIRLRRKPKPKRKSIEIIASDGGGGAIGHMEASAPASRERYDNPGQNTWTSTAKDNLSTFAADVDGGSFTVARRKLNEGHLPPKDSVRPEEWVNYFTYDYPQPTEGVFGVAMEAAPSPFSTDGNVKLVQIGVQAKKVSTNRKPVHLTFLVDVSGSMSRPDKLGLAVKSMKYMVNALQPRDTVAITTYAGGTRTVLEPTTAESKGRIIEALEMLQTGGGTAMDDGLKAAYDLAEEVFVEGHENRVIVLSDGDANVGRTGIAEMHETIAKGAKRGITMSTIGFGTGNYNDARMEQLANKGNGNYYYIDGFPEAQRVFGEQMNGTLVTVARDVKLQVEFNKQAVKRYRLIGYENRDVADKDFRNDSVDAGEIGAGHAVTALYEVELADEALPVLATLRIRHRAPDNKGETREITAVLPRERVATKLSRRARTSVGLRLSPRSLR